MRPSLWYAIGLVSLIVAPSFAQSERWIANRSSDTRYSESSQRFNLDLAAEGGQLRAQGRALTGMGFGAGARYAVYDRWALGLRLGQALSWDAKGPSALYTSITSQLLWAPWGSFVEDQKTLWVSGQPAISLQRKQRSFLSLGLGFEQFLLNGTAFAVPSTGLSLQVSYTFGLLGNSWVLSAKTGLMLLNEQVAVPVVAGLGPTWRF